LKTSEVESHWRTTSFKRSSNLRRDLNAAVKEGWIAREGKG
jgi:hypothetical protein